MSVDLYRLYSEIIAEEMNRPVDVVFEEIESICHEYHIPVTYYANHRLFYKNNPEELKKHSELILRDRDELRNRIMNITRSDMAKTCDYCDDIRHRFGLGEKEILDLMLYQKQDDEIERIVEEKKEKKEARNKRISEKSGMSLYDVEKHIRKCKAIFGISNGEYESTRCYECTDDELRTYANLYDSRLLAAKYIKADIKVLNDKILFDETFRKYLKRDFLVNKDCSLEDFKKFLKGKKEVFIKPIDLHGGLGARKIEVPKDIISFYIEIIKEPLLLMEEVLTQERAMNKFYSGSINTIRLFTLIDENDEFHAFASFVRFGVNGITDNISTGGIGCGVDEKTGKIITNAMGSDGIIYEKHPVTGRKFIGYKIPHWKKILKVTEEALRKVPGLHFVGWDIALTRKGVALVEGNSIPCLSIYQSFFTETKEGRKYKYERFL